jgi:hypothetical protein
MAPAHSQYGTGTAERSPLVAVVGVCAVGKSTLAAALRQYGYHVLEVAQEHSELPYLWARHDPAFLIYLDADDAVLRQRRSYLLPERLRRQRRCLTYARACADLALDTTGHSIAGVSAMAVAALSRAGVAGVSKGGPAQNAVF